MFDLLLALAFKASFVASALEDNNGYLLSFQPTGKLSNTTFATYSDFNFEADLLNLTVCYWFNLHFHHTTISLASYCAPADNCEPVKGYKEKPKCSNIRELNSSDRLNRLVSLESLGQFRGN